MTTLRMHAYACDEVAELSLRDEPSPGVAIQDQVLALVAVLVALVHHCRSCSVTLHNRTGMFQSPRQMRGCLRWRVTERD